MTSTWTPKQLKPESSLTALSSLQGIHLADHPAAFCRWKRAMDIGGALIGLGLTALIFPIVALAIYLEDPGPILYSQVRCGLKGRSFAIWKFRSMVVNADQLQHLVTNQAQGNMFKNRCDPRVTKVGAFLRKTSLDEFPQFWNVLRGEMSLVGTRPPTVGEVLQYRRHHWERLRVKPGITGEWQINGRSSVSDFEEVVALDISYQRKWSILYDILVVIKTLGVIFNRSGAY